MMKQRARDRLLSLLLVIVLCAGFVLPAGATGRLDVSGVTAEQVGNEEVSAKPSGLRTLDQPKAAALYSGADTVRVSILLREQSTLEKMADVGVMAADVASEPKAMDYRATLKRQQANVERAISAQALDGEKLDVVWNLTLAANIISANVQYDQIEKIKQVEGVEDVIIENRYDPMVTSERGGGGKPQHGDLLGADRLRCCMGSRIHGRRTADCGY